MVVSYQLGFFFAFSIVTDIAKAVSSDLISTWEECQEADVWDYEYVLILMM